MQEISRWHLKEGYCIREKESLAVNECSKFLKGQITPVCAFSRSIEYIAGQK